MGKYYTSERNAQILIALMKRHGIKKVVVSPGTTNVTFVASIQQDSFFEIYSSVDERSAAYIACGMAAESGEAVALSCTGATASRNYIPGLTEAYYRKIPVLAITSTQPSIRIGQNIPQVIDRREQLNDITKLSIQVPTVHDSEEAWGINVAINTALLELKRHGGGPVHINLTTEYDTDFSTKSLPEERVIDRVTIGQNLPKLVGERIGVFVGAHKKWDASLTDAVNKFCEAYNAVVFCDHTSNYEGPYKVLADLVCSQDQYDSPLCKLDVLIHIGDISGSSISLFPGQVWRVNPDGEVRDTFKKLRFVFEMDEAQFFLKYSDMKHVKKAENSYLSSWKSECSRISNKIGDLPFSNGWVAQNTLKRLPDGSVLHLGILNSLRCWNFFESPKGVLGYANTGGFGIDGGVSALMGASFANPQKLFFGVFGDLAFFYDLNVNGNRHVGNNVRIILVNNGEGVEFKNYNNLAADFGNRADEFIAAQGHFGQKSGRLVKDLVMDLGYDYLVARNKEEYLKNLKQFVSPKMAEKPMVFEVFTNGVDESNALRMMRNLDTTVNTKAKIAVRAVVKKVLGTKRVKMLKKIIKNRV